MDTWFLLVGVGFFSLTILGVQRLFPRLTK